MKRLLLIFLTITLVFSACGRKEKDANINTVADAVLEALDTKEGLTLADEDFAETNFTCDDEIEECKIYLGEEREIGILRLDDDGNAAVTERAIKEYLQSEASSITSLLELYPSEVLEERLTHYQNATVAQKGRYICYFALPKAEAEKALAEMG